jgi:hypothetical protein
LKTSLQDCKWLKHRLSRPPKCEGNPRRWLGLTQNSPRLPFFLILTFLVVAACAIRTRKTIPIAYPQMLASV